MLKLNQDKSISLSFFPISGELCCKSGFQKLIFLIKKVGCVIKADKFVNIVQRKHDMPNITMAIGQYKRKIVKNFDIVFF